MDRVEPTYLSYNYLIGYNSCRGADVIIGNFTARVSVVASHLDIIVMH